MRSFSRRTALVAATVAATAVLAPWQASASAPRDYEQAGPHQVTKVAGGPDQTLYYPSDLASDTAVHPVLVWGNGTGATPSQYDQFLTHAASWGFVVSAANTTNSGTGSEMLAGARFLVSENKKPGSVFHGKIDEGKIGAAGHSQGGQGAINAAADPLIKTVIPIMPGPLAVAGRIKSPAFFVSGQSDVVVWPATVKAKFEGASQVPAVYGQLKGTGHLLPEPGRTRLIGAATAWLRYFLAGDANAKSAFFGDEASTGLAHDPGWSAFERNAKADALG
ncbi:hypothetical protein SAMN05421504_101838 [Amycolatopsis xylanica]|uniref:PET hydrolase/cutinase-like domain-containing protein n=1 Tax=Amycolatopsis xylanica TaxID=589385 RepID=A0A1H2UBE2_9PSEU|nr:hypothetical protein [Amycolatopsis xylanica]SDW53390.1 hypothetical protein SAMN05421504_101838 [Amycolatopsis xylanica]